jgi:diacylglycerol kinase (ATP)
MRTTLIVNPAGGSAGEAQALVRERARELGWELCIVEPGTAGDAARAAVGAGAELVIAGGGDGTVSDVTQGLLGSQAVLGVLPLGTGNDFARALRMPLEVEPALAVLAGADRGHRRPIDVLEVVHEGGTRLCIDALNGGLAATIRENLDDGLKVRLGPLAFVWAALGSLTALERWPITFRVDGGDAHSSEVVSFIVANTGTVGGGLAVAPNARLDDGCFDLVIVRGDASLAQLTMTAIRARFGDIFASHCVDHIRGSRLELLEYDDGLRFTADGEDLPPRVREVNVLAGALPALHGAPPSDP